MKQLLVFLWMLLLWACVEPVDLDPGGGEELLVIQGSLTNELKHHQVRISTTSQLDDTGGGFAPFSTVWVMDAVGNRFAYAQTSTPGLYESLEPYQGQIGQTYTLFVNQGQKQIVSEPQLLVGTAPIDSVYVEARTLLTDEFIGEQEGLQFFLDATDLGDFPLAFRYELTEGYETRVAFPSSFVWNQATQQAVRRDTALSACFKQSTSDEFFVASTLSQSENTIRQFPLNFVPIGSEKVQFSYGLKVRQLVISAEAFEFYRTLNENNQSSGSLFDSQKGTVVGNLSVVDDPVTQILGYFEVAGASETTIQLDFAALRALGVDRLSTLEQTRNCNDQADTIPGLGLADFFSSAFNVRNFGIGPQAVEDSPFPSPDGIFVVAPLECTDCRQNGATLEKPDFLD